MTLLTGPFLPLAALIWPLMLGAAAALPGLRAHSLRLLPLAPLPALALALFGAAGETQAPDLLLGVVLQAEPAGHLLLGMTALLWLAAGVFVQSHMAGTHNPAVFSGFWCLTLAGNLGVFLAADIITFYVAFAAVSLAAYLIVIHARSVEALRAGRVYIAMAIIGEACLLLGFLIGAGAADSLRIAEIRAALPGADLGGWATGLMIVGFGIKAGLVPLHVWLPLAHPVAPVPGSAVLSGAIVKAGAIGMVLFLPDGATAGLVLLWLGLVGAFGAALVGLGQDNPKTVLAYSTVSQMGLVSALIGAALAAGASRDGAVFYALHHGLAKGALFLAAGLAIGAGRGWRAAVIAAAAVVALSVAGLPLTGGALSKAAAKSAISGAPEMALTLSGLFTALLLLHFLARLRAAPLPDAPARPGALTLAPTLVLGVAALALPWLLWPQWSGLPAAYPLRGGVMFDALWPVALGAGLGALALWRGWRMPAVPPGDLLALLHPLGMALRESSLVNARRALRWPRVRAGLEPGTRRAEAATRDLTEAIEAALLKWRWSGLAVVLLALAVVLGAG